MVDLQRRVVRQVVLAVEAALRHPGVLLEGEGAVATVVLDGAVERLRRDHRARASLGNPGIRSSDRYRAEVGSRLNTAPPTPSVEHVGQRARAASLDSTAVDGSLLAHTSRTVALRPGVGRGALAIHAAHGGRRSQRDDLRVRSGPAGTRAVHREGVLPDRAHRDGDRAGGTDRTRDPVRGAAVDVVRHPADRDGTGSGEVVRADRDVHGRRERRSQRDDLRVRSGPAGTRAVHREGVLPDRAHRDGDRAGGTDRTRDPVRGAAVDVVRHPADRDGTGSGEVVRADRDVHGRRERRSQREGHRQRTRDVDISLVMPLVALRRGVQLVAARRQTDRLPGTLVDVAGEARRLPNPGLLAIGPDRVVQFHLGHATTDDVVVDSVGGDRDAAPDVERGVRRGGRDPHHRHVVDGRRRGVHAGVGRRRVAVDRRVAVLGVRVFGRAVLDTAHEGGGEERNESETEGVLHDRAFRVE